MKNPIGIAIAMAGMALGGCGSHHSSPAASTPSGNTAPTDFAQFVNQQVAMQPSFGTEPVSTASLSSDTALGNPQAFGTASFGTGDALPAGTSQASVACTQAGTTACNPALSADLNSNLN
jgi:hypothetical protein